ncbi:MAG TPA: hypothetical protein DDZ66_09130, partial [Firmicutes bacterium]|jgi:GTP-binding protein HflX|nr:hypothetical protein [Bacillota bacterium]
MEQQEAVEEVLKEIGAAAPVISVYNKVDLVAHPIEVRGPEQAISAKTGYQLEKLAEAVDVFFAEKFSLRQYLFPFDKLSQASYLRDNAHIITEEFVAEGLIIKAEVDQKTASILRSFEN